MAARSKPTASPQLPAFLRQSKAEIQAKFVDLEWQQRERLLHGTQQPADSQWSRLEGDSITARNRYLNVEPFAQNRIKLRVAGEGVSDYINASPIRLGNRTYIATQGPKDTSVNHFYRMLAHEVKSPIVVVMLTQTHEAGREKCFQYYPLSAKESPLKIPVDDEIADGFKGDVQLQSVKNHAASRSQMRKLRLRTTDDGVEGTQEKEMYHLLYSAWPDFYVPEDEDRRALIELVRLSASLTKKSSIRHSVEAEAHTNGSSTATDLSSIDPDNPRIIHCSAGVGRSGTFIALDYLLAMMHSGQFDETPSDSDPIVDVVDSLRQQRMMMVQGESQFNFLYDVVRELLQVRLGITGGGEDAAAHSAASGTGKEATESPIDDPVQ